VPLELCRTELMEDLLDVALPADHPLASRDSIAVAELRAEDWISRSTGQICHDWLIRTLGANGTRPRVKHTASEHSTQLALLGAAVIPRLGREPTPPSVRTRRYDNRARMLARLTCLCAPARHVIRGDSSRSQQVWHDHWRDGVCL
jgi:hypothetical protein